jgi:hypothetical protein
MHEIHIAEARGPGRGVEASKQGVFSTKNIFMHHQRMSFIKHEANDMIESF